MLDHYLHTGQAAGQLFSTALEPITLAPPSPGVTPEQIADKQHAVAWYQAELQVLLAIAALAAQAGFDVHAWQIPFLIAPFLDHRGPWHEEVTLLRDAVMAATRLGDIPGQAISRRRLAHAHGMLGEHEQAEAHLMQSLSLYRQAGDRVGEARVHGSLSWVKAKQGPGHLAESLRHDEQALHLLRAAGHRHVQAAMLNNIGYSWARLGDYEQALAFCRQALDLARELGDRQAEAHTWDSLGYAHHHLGHYAKAARCYQQAIVLYVDLGDRHGQAETLTHLGDMRRAASGPEAATSTWRQALDILDALHHPDAGQVRDRLERADELVTSASGH
jgi:tetratricopeptide (TPR) repeat protein